MPPVRQRVRQFQEKSAVRQTGEGLAGQSSLPGHQSGAGVQAQEVDESPLARRLVRADGFPQLRFVPHDIQHIVPNLERKPDLSGIGCRGVLLGLGSGFFYALYSIFGRYALAHYPPLTVTVWTFLFAGPASLVLLRPAELAAIL